MSTPDTVQDDFADVLGTKPVVIVFATPALCQSRVCGPVVDDEDHLVGAVTVDDVLDHLLPEDWRDQEVAGQ